MPSDAFRLRTLRRQASMPSDAFRLRTLRRQASKSSTTSSDTGCD